MDLGQIFFREKTACCIDKPPLGVKICEGVSGNGSLLLNVLFDHEGGEFPFVIGIAPESSGSAAGDVDENPVAFSNQPV